MTPLRVPTGWSQQLPSTQGSLAVFQAGELVVQPEPTRDEGGLHGQDVDAIPKAKAVEGIADAPTDEDAAPSAADHCCVSLSSLLARGPAPTGQARASVIG